MTPLWKYLHKLNKADGSEQHRVYVSIYTESIRKYADEEETFSKMAKRPLAKAAGHVKEVANDLGSSCAPEARRAKLREYAAAVHDFHLTFSGGFDQHTFEHRLCFERVCKELGVPRPGPMLTLDEYDKVIRQLAITTLNAEEKKSAEAIKKEKQKAREHAQHGKKGKDSKDATKEAPSTSKKGDDKAKQDSSPGNDSGTH